MGDTRRNSLSLFAWRALVWTTLRCSLLEALGKTEADLEPSATPFVVSFFAALLTALVLALLLAPMQVSGWLDGAVLGLWVGLGFIATAMASDASFCRWGLKLFLIQSGYRVLYSVLMGGILGYWQ